MPVLTDDEVGLGVLTDADVGLGKTEPVLTPEQREALAAEPMPPRLVMPPSTVRSTIAGGPPLSVSAPAPFLPLQEKAAFDLGFAPLDPESRIDLVGLMPEVAKEDSMAMGMAKAALQNIAGVPEFFTSDAGVTSLLFGSMPGTRRLVGAYWAQDLIRSAYKQAKDSTDNWNQLTDAQKGQAIVNFAVTSGLAAGAAGLGAGVKTRQVSPAALGETVARIPRGAEGAATAIKVLEQAKAAPPVEPAVTPPPVAPGREEPVPGVTAEAAEAMQAGVSERLEAGKAAPGTAAAEASARAQAAVEAGAARVEAAPLEPLNEQAFKELRLEGVTAEDAMLLLEGKKTVKEVVEGNFKVTPAFKAVPGGQGPEGHAEAWEQGYNQAIERLTDIVERAKKPAAPAAQPEGVQDASSIEKTAAVYGDVRTQPEQGAGQVPVKEGGKGVQPQAAGGLPVPAERQVPLTSPASPSFAERSVPLLEHRMGQLQTHLIDSDSFAGSEFYDKSFPIPRQGGIVAARYTQRYQSDPFYRARVDASIRDITDTIVQANRQRMSLLGKPVSGNFGVSYSIGKARAGYTVNVVRAWHNEAIQKYPNTSLLGNVAVREGIQNSLDAVLQGIEEGQIKRGTIDVTILEENKGYVIDDNGIGMSDLDIGEKFLALHSTGKAVEGRFGGFGIAKAVILGPSETATWKLHTRDNVFDHELAQANEFVKAGPWRQGTRIEVTTKDTIVDEQAKQYAETTEVPDNISIKYNGVQVKSPFARRIGRTENVVISPETSYDMTYYPKIAAEYNKKQIIRLVDEKTGAKLTQGIIDIYNEGFRGAVVIDIKTKTVPGTYAYPLTDSRMEMKYGANRDVAKLIEKHSIDPMTAKREGIQFTFHDLQNRTEWQRTIAKAGVDPEYQNLLKVINDVWMETGQFEGTTSRPITPLTEMRIKIDRGYSGYFGGTLFQAKHAAAYESVARLLAPRAGAKVSDFYALLSKPVDGGTVASEHSAAGLLGINLNSVDKTALKNPITYGLYLRDLVCHELTHDFFGKHNEEFTSQNMAIQNATSHLMPHVFRIAEAVMGKELEIGKKVVRERVAVEVPVTRDVQVEKFLTPEQLQFIYDNYEKPGTGKPSDDLYSPGLEGATAQLELEQGRSGERGLRIGGTPQDVGTRGGTQLPDAQGAGVPSARGLEPSATGRTGTVELPSVGAASAAPGGIPPRAAIEQLADAFAGKAPTAERLAAFVRNAFNFGARGAKAKDALSAAVQGMKTSGTALWDALTKFQTPDDLLKAKGDLSAELETRGWRVRQFVRNVQASVPDKARRAAIAKWIDAGGDDAVLAAGEAATKPEYKQAYRDARNLTPDERIQAENIQVYFDTRLREAIDAGVLEHGLDDYIHRIYEKDPSLVKRALAYVQSGILSRNPALAKKRLFEFDWQAEQQGFRPVQDFLPRIAAYEASLSRAIAARKFVQRMSELTAPEGRPIVGIKGVGVPLEDPTTGVREGTVIKPLGDFRKNRDASDALNYRGDYEDREFPALSKWKWVSTDAGGKPIFVQGDVAIHPDYVKRVDALLRPSSVRKYAPLRTAQAISATVKQTMLDMSFFHQVQIAVHGLEHRVNPFRLVQEIDFENPNVQGLLKGGVTLGGEYYPSNLGEGLVGRSLTKYIPGLGEILETYHGWLFQDFIPRMKLTMGLHALERNRKRYAADLASGRMSEDALHLLTAKQANAAFGELNYTMLERNKTVQDMARLVLLAPDFLEARGRFVAQALTKYGTEQRVALLLGAITMWTAARVMNKIADDQWHLEPENLFNLVYKNNAYGLRTVQGDVIHMLTKFWPFWMNRMNPAFVRWAIELGTGRDQFGRTRNAWQQLTDFVSTAMPIALRTSRERHLWESLLNSFGVTARRWNDVKNAHELASKWKKENNIREQPGEFIYDSDKDPLRPLKIALSEQDDPGAVKELKRVLDRKVMTPEQVDKYFNRYAAAPFTGSKANDVRFMASLTADDKKTVQAAQQHRRAMLELYRKTRRQLQAATQPRPAMPVGVPLPAPVPLPPMFPQ